MTTTTSKTTRNSLMTLEEKAYLKRVQNRKDCQKAYDQSRKNCKALIARITRAINDQPETPGEMMWASVGSMKHIEAQLKELSDQLNHEGEYAR